MTHPGYIAAAYGLALANRREVNGEKGLPVGSVKATLGRPLKLVPSVYSSWPLTVALTLPIGRA